MSRRARMEIAVYPLGTGADNVSACVGRTLPVLERSGLVFEVTPMGTLVEGTPGELFALAQHLHETVFAPPAGRVVTLIRIDDRGDDA